MSTNLQTQPGNGAQSAGGVWYRLRSEREDICEALVTESRSAPQTQTGFAGLTKADAPEITIATESWHRELLQARLRKVDDALDRLMSGTYGECCKCGKWIEDTKLDFDPAIAYCLGCWRRVQTSH
jgi:DnaK suppressor protein